MVEEEILEALDSLMHHYEALMDEVGNDAIGRELFHFFEVEKERLVQMERHMEADEE